jgi:hypothetical protein
MLSLSFALVLIAAALGAVLVWLHLRPGAPRPGWRLGALHGVLGTAALATLALALRGPPRGEALGVGPFGGIAAVLLTLALAMGLVLPLIRRRRGRLTSGPIGIHAMIAISGVAILAAYTLVG